MGVGLVGERQPESGVGRFSFAETRFTRFQAAYGG